MHVDDEERDLRSRFWHPAPGDTVLDVGAFAGSWTLPALRAGAIVHAIDVDTTRLARIAGLPDVTVTRAAVGEAYPPELLEQIDESMRPTGAPWITLDDYVDEHALTVDWLKIDIEGGELQALRGARRTLRRDRPTVIVEEHSRVYDLPGNLELVIGELLDHGYDLRVEELRGYERSPIHVIGPRNA